MARCARWMMASPFSRAIVAKGALPPLAGCPLNPNLVAASRSTDVAAGCGPYRTAARPLVAVCHVPDEASIRQWEPAHHADDVRQQPAARPRVIRQVPVAC